MGGHRQAALNAVEFASSRTHDADAAVVAMGEAQVYAALAVADAIDELRNTLDNLLPMAGQGNLLPMAGQGI